MWHYDAAGVNTVGHLPTFLVGRNPYRRLLSGYFDKMVRTRRVAKVSCAGVLPGFTSANTRAVLVWSLHLHHCAISHWIAPTRIRSSSHLADAASTGVQSVNKRLGIPQGKRHRETPEDFADFVRKLAPAKFENFYGVNGHFKPMADIGLAAKVQYEYLLKLEELTSWLPCWSEVRPALATAPLGKRRAKRHSACLHGQQSCMQTTWPARCGMPRSGMPCGVQVESP